MINIIRGDDVTISVTCKDSTGAVLNITGYTVYFTVKASISDTDAEAVIAKQVTNHTNPTQGVTAIVLADTETNLAEGDYIYDFQLKDGSGNISSSSRDYLTVTADVTIRTT